MATFKTPTMHSLYHGAAHLTIETLMAKNFAGTLGRTEKGRLELMARAVGRFVGKDLITDTNE